MPREIMTIQIGQCGNQSTLNTIELEHSSGNNFAVSMELTPVASYKTTLPITMASKTEKMYFSIKPMMTITFLDQS